MILNKDLYIVRSKIIQWTQDDVEKFYAEHKSRLCLVIHLLLDRWLVSVIMAIIFSIGISYFWKM